MQGLKIHIHGKVHKTGMLYFIKQRAFENNINGRVFYYADFSIGILAEGEKQEMDTFIETCRKGKSGSVIKSFHICQTTLQEFNSFDVIDEYVQIETKSEYYYKN